MSRVSEAIREKEVDELASHLFENVEASPIVTECGNGTPCPSSRSLTSSDSSLVAFAQLGVHRLGGCRCLISIFDRKSQYVVAEATPLSSLAPNCHNSEGLLLGGTAIPRSLGICEHVLLATNEDEKYSEDEAARRGALPILVVSDLADDSRFSDWPFIKKYPYNHFYAGIPIRTRRGINIGVYSVFDDKPRDGLDDYQIQFLQDMSWTIVDHLDATKESKTCRQSDRMVRGIGSFLKEESRTSLPQSLDDAASLATNDLTTSKPDEDLHLNAIKINFGKAANILRKAIEVEGVLFLDASVGSFGGLIRRDEDPSVSDHLSDTGSISESLPKLRDESEGIEERACRVFGLSTSQGSSGCNSSQSRNYIGLTEKFLSTLLRRYPTGSIFNFDDEGGIQYSDSEEGSVSPSTDVLAQSPTRAGERSRKRSRRENEAKLIISSFPGSRSVMLVPVWDSHKERWFAGGFVWTKSPTRVLTVEGELSFLRAFGTMTMAEIFRNNAILAEKTRSDLLGSVSHELRSPLHGIVAAVELLQDTELDAFQGDVLHSMESCGRTLLDVIDHLLDYSKINKFAEASKDTANARMHEKVTEKQKIFASKMTRLQSDVQIDALVEESVESIFTGYNFQQMSIAQLVRYGKSKHYDVDEMQRMDSIDAIESLGHQTRNSGARDLTTCAVSIYLDIDPGHHWLYHTEPGALRRIIINLLGNSLKYTSHGHIIVSLKQEPPCKSHPDYTNLKITVSDTGKGIGAEFLNNHIFTPFSQEDPLNPGTGLGLTLVHQIAKSLSGSIQIESHLDHGTSVRVILPLSPSRISPTLDPIFGDHVIALKGLRVSLLGMKNHIDIPGLAATSQPTELDLMEALCRDWLQLNIIPPGSIDVIPELIVCPDTSLEEVVSRGSDANLPAVVIICRSAAAAHVLRADQQEAKQRNIFQYISQPAGPRKVAKAMVMALMSWNNFKSSESWYSQSPLATDEQSSHSPVSTTPSTPAVNTDQVVEPIFSIVPTPQQPQLRVKPTQKIREVTFAAHPPLILTLPPHLRESSSSETSSESLSQSQNGRAGGEIGRHKHQTILLVDDNKINLQILSSFTKKLKLQYRTASNGREALDLFTSSTERICCVLMDISMPVMDGLESTRRIREHEGRRKLIPAVIIALTGLASAGTQQEAFASGIDIFMTKPVKLKQLAELLGMKKAEVTEEARHG